jgi:DNA adenine methylase
MIASPPQARASSFLRWAGSKRQLVSTLAEHWQPGFRRYVEPFVGSACLFFRLRPDRALLGDINSTLIHTYREVARNPIGVAAAVNRFATDRATYLRVRAQPESGLSDTARASRFIYLNRYCFNGLYRTNRRGQFNVPYGGGRSGSLPTQADLELVSDALRGVELASCDFAETLRRTTPGDFVYLDPPFTVRSRRVFAEYDASAFDEDSLMRLRIGLESLAFRGIPFLLSYAESDEARFLADGFAFRSVRVRRNIGGFSARRADARELLIAHLC